MIEAVLILSVPVALYLPGHFLDGSVARQGDCWTESALLRVSCAALATPILVVLALIGWFRAPLLLECFVPSAIAAWALAVGLAFLLGSELSGRWAGLLGAALLATSYTQAWWSRYPSSEVLTQFFILAGLWLVSRFVRGGGATTGVMAGLLFGGASPREGVGGARCGCWRTPPS